MQHDKYEEDFEGDSVSSYDEHFTKRNQYNQFGMDPIAQRICISAITGQRFYDQLTGQPIIQNSLASRQLWSVMDCTAPNGAKDPLKLYYDTPEQYERHRRVKVSRSSKESWRKGLSELGYNVFGVSNTLTDPKTEFTVVK